jgi:outer membrane cobalamin receptor
MNNFCQQKTIENILPENSLLKIFTAIFFYTQIISVIVLLLLSNPPIFAQEKLDQFFPQDSITVRDDSLAATKTVEHKRYPPDSGFKNIIWELPKSIINQYFHEDLGDVLHYIPGVFLFDFGSSGQELQAGFHGANNRQVAIVFDDRPLFDPVYGGFDLNFLPVAFIRKLDVQTGLSTPLVLSNSEIISVSSDDYGEDAPYSQVSYHKAPYGYSDVDAVFGQRISRKMTLLVGGFIKSFDGKTVSQNFEQQNVRMKINYTLSPRWNFQYSLLNNKLNRHILNPDLDDISFQLPNATQKNNRIDHTLKINGRLFGSFNESFRANVFYSNQESKITDKVSNLRLNTPATYFGFNLKNGFSILGQNAAIGGNFIHQKTDADSIGKQQHSSGSLFAQFHWNVTDKIRTDINGNLLFHNLFQTQFSGGITSYFQITKSLELSLCIKQSIRYPTFFELNSKGTFIGDPVLKEEIHREINSGLRLKLKPNISLMTNVYLKSIDRFVDIQTIDTLTARFLNRTKSMQFAGADVQLNWDIFSRLSTFFAFQTIDNTNLFDQPQYKFTSYLQYSDSLFQNDLCPTLRLEGVVIGARKSNYSNRFYLLQSPENLNPLFLFNAHLVLNFGNLKVFISLENILDKKYQMIYGFPMKERSLHYGIRWEFWN